MADISQITLPSGTTYNIKDATARDQIDQITGYTSFLGVTTTPLTDGSTTNPITINGNSVTAVAGNITTYGSAEFIFNGTAWQAFGDLSGLGALAYKNSASGSFTPAGTISKPLFSGTQTGVTITTSETQSQENNYTPHGVITKPTFTGSESTFTGEFTPDGSVVVAVDSTSNKTATVSTTTGTATYTPGGTVSQPSFTGSAMTVSGDYAPSGTITLDTSSRYAAVTVDPNPGPLVMKYTPTGTISTPTITVTPSTTTVNSITNVGTLPTFSATVANEVQTLDFSQGTLPTKGGNTTVVTGVSSATASQPTFTGTAVALRAGYEGVDAATFYGTEEEIELYGTPSGIVSQPTFSGTGVRLVTGNIPVPSMFRASFVGVVGNVSVTGTPSGSVSQPSFAGTPATISGTVTPYGTISTPTFTGTAGTVEVS